MRRLIPFLLVVGLTSCAPAHAGLSAGSSRLGRAGSLMEYLMSDFIYDISGPLTVSAALTGSGNLIKLGTGTLTLAGANTYTGTTTLNAGYLTINTVAGTGGIINNTSGVFDALHFNCGTRTVANVISGDGSFICWSNPSTITFSGANTFSGAVTIGSGTEVSVGSFNSVATNAGLGTVKSASSNLGAPSSVANGTISLGSIGVSSSAKLLYTGSGETTDRVLSLNSGGGSTLTVTHSGTGLLKFVSNLISGGSSKTLVLQGSTAGTGEISGVIPNNSSTNKTSITKDGTGTWTLSGANTYTGTTAIAAGVLTCATVPDGSPITLAATSWLNITGTLNTSGTINASGGNSVVEKIVYTGAGETTGRAITLTSGGAGSNFTLDQSGASGLLKFTGTVQRTAANTCALILQGSTAGTGELAGVISASSGSIPVTKLGTGTWTLSGTNTFANGVTVTGGTLIAANASAFGTGAVSIGAAGLVQLAAGGTYANAFGITGTGTTAYSLQLLTGLTATLSGTITHASSTTARLQVESGATLTATGSLVLSATSTNNLLFQGDGDTWITGNISGAGQLSRSGLGSGTLYLSGTNTNTGSVSIYGGILCGQTTSGANVALTTGTVSIGTGSTTGTIQPGSFGNNTLTMGALVFYSSTRARVIFNSTASTFSKITVTGNVALAGVGLIFPAGVTTNGTYDLIVASGTMSGTMPTIVTNSTGKTLTLQQTGNTLQVVVSG